MNEQQLIWLLKINQAQTLPLTVNESGNENILSLTFNGFIEVSFDQGDKEILSLTKKGRDRVELIKQIAGL